MSRADRDRLKNLVKADAVFIFNKNQNTTSIVNTKSMKRRIDINDIATEFSKRIKRKSDFSVNELNDDQKH